MRICRFSSKRELSTMSRTMRAMRSPCVRPSTSRTHVGQLAVADQAGADGVVEVVVHVGDDVG